jgi:hypothetical protein
MRSAEKGFLAHVFLFKIVLQKQASSSLTVAAKKGFQIKQGW